MVRHHKFINYLAFTTISESLYYDFHYDVWNKICQEFRCSWLLLLFFLFSLSLSHFAFVYDIRICKELNVHLCPISVHCVFAFRYFDD